MGGKIPFFTDYYQQFSKEYAVGGMKGVISASRDNIILPKGSSICLQLCLFLDLIDSLSSPMKMEK